MTEATEVENAMYELANNACRALGVDSDKVEDPVGPVTARESVIYAMYRHAENIEAARQVSLPVQGEPVGKYQIGDRVTKTKGSNWTGRVVGFYSTSLTPIGYAVESETERGSVQIYPESALAIAQAQEPTHER